MMIYVRWHIRRERDQCVRAIDIVMLTLRERYERYATNATNATNFSGHYRTGVWSVCIVCYALRLQQVTQSKGRWRDVLQRDITSAFYLRQGIYSDFASRFLPEFTPGSIQYIAGEYMVHALFSKLMYLEFINHLRIDFINHQGYHALRQDRYVV